MAAISLHALMRHQNQRRIRTSPRPAPASMMNAHAPEIVSRTAVMARESAMTTMVVMRDRRTRSRSPACGFTKRL